MIAPLVIEVPDDGSRLRRDFVENRKRIGFVHPITMVMRGDMVFEKRSLTDLRKKSLPDARLPFGIELVMALIPTIEIADDGDLLRVRRPNREISAARAAVGDEMRAELVIQLKMAAFIKQVKVVIREQAHCFMGDHGFFSPPLFANLADALQSFRDRLHLT